MSDVVPCADCFDEDIQRPAVKRIGRFNVCLDHYAVRLPSFSKMHPVPEHIQRDYDIALEQRLLWAARDRQ